MTKSELNEFIERMEVIGDIWSLEDAKRVYGNKTLEEALSERLSAIQIFGNIIGTVLNADSDE